MIAIAFYGLKTGAGHPWQKGFVEGEACEERTWRRHPDRD
jgi:hypothetical protein